MRAGMFLTFLSMSFVALALVAQAMSFGESFLSIAALVLAFDFVVGVTTFLRMNGANFDDLRALHGMARIRHAYTQITPLVTPYFTVATHDDIDAVLTAYGPLPERLSGQFLYGLSTSSGMIALIVSMVGGVLTTVLAMLIGLEGSAPTWTGVAGGIVVLAALFAFTERVILREQRRFTVLFPTPVAEPVVSARSDEA
ncbi:MAG: hypothetical protein ABI534_08305 [Chloroflexota bacterium]